MRPNDYRDWLARRHSQTAPSSVDAYAVLAAGLDARELRRQEFSGRQLDRFGRRLLPEIEAFLSFYAIAREEC